MKTLKQFIHEQTNKKSYYGGKVAGTYGGAMAGSSIGDIAGAVVGRAITKNPVGMLAGAALGSLSGSVYGGVKGYKWGKKVDNSRRKANEENELD